MRIVMIVFYLVLILAGVVFAVLNASPVQLNLYFSTYKMPISVLITLSLGLGILVGALLVSVRYWRLKMEYRKINNQLKLNDKEIRNLRAIPLQDQH